MACNSPACNLNKNHYTSNTFYFSFNKMRGTKWIEENYKEDLSMYMEEIIHSYDGNLTCYDNFKELLSEIYSTAFEKGFLYGSKK